MMQCSNIHPQDIICLCGSTRYHELFKEYEVSLSLKGAIVLSPLVYNQSDSQNDKVNEEQKATLDRLQEAKIDLCDYVFIIDGSTGYVGESTMRQIEFAQSIGRPVYYYSKGELPS